MAIKNIKEIIDNRGYVINPNDRKIFEAGDLQSFFGLSNNDAIEFIIYDINNNQLPQIDGEFVRYIPLNTSNISNYFLIAEGTVFQKYQLPTEYFIDVEKLLKEAGYKNGIFKVQITLINRRIGSEKKFDKLWIQQISPSRTEVRLQPLKDGIKLNSELKVRYDAFVNDNDFIEDINIYLPEFVEKISPSEVLSFIKTQYTDEWYSKLVDEFKIGDFQKFITNIHSKFIEAVLYEFNNKISNISDINFGKPKQTKIPLALSKTTIINICERILAEIIEYYLPTQNIIQKASKVIDFIPSEDPVSDILQRKDSDILYKSKTIQTEVRALIYPEISERQITLERFIEKEVPLEKILPVVVEVGEPPYVPSPPPQDVVVVPAERLIVTPIVIEPVIDLPTEPVQSIISQPIIPVFTPPGVVITQPEPVQTPVIVQQPIITQPISNVIQIGTPVGSTNEILLDRNVFDTELPELRVIADEEIVQRFLTAGEALFPRLL
jgi:hypothetical protein